MGDQQTIDRLAGDYIDGCTYIDVLEVSPPGTPATGKVRIYAKADGKMYIKDDGGIETDITTAGGSIPTGTGFRHVTAGVEDPVAALITAVDIVGATITDVQVAATNKDGLASVASLRTLGTGAQVACAGNDARLSDARTPTAHAASHKSGGGDPIKLNEFANPDAAVQFSQQQALQFRVENRTSDPTTPSAGEMWLRTDL